MQPSAHSAEHLVVRVDGGLVEGWIADAGCPECKGPAVYVLAYDATCCPSCNRWLELRCPDPGCIHCQCRPAQPF